VPPAAPLANANPSRPQPQSRRSNPVHTAAASLETVERALGDLRVSNGNDGRGGRGGRRGYSNNAGGGGGAKVEQIKVPATDFDFESSNAKFDKAALSPRGTGKRVVGSVDEDEVATNPSDVEGEGESNGKVRSKEKEKEDGEKEREKEKAAYNPQKSFFDSLSSSTQGPPPPSGRGGAGEGRRGGGRGGGGIGRNRREEERERNVATFGEPGGVGLMGPGAYVGGWGGYGRRGGRRGRGGIAGAGLGVVGR